MTPKQYCYKKVYIPGSTFFYSIKKLPKKKRDAMVAVQAFYNELEDVVFHFTDIGVAQARLNWWRTEIIKISQAQPDHPVSLFLKTQNFDSKNLLDLIDGMEQCLSYLQFNTFEDVFIHLMRTAGVREMMFAEILQGNIIDKELIYQAMLVIELPYYIQHLRKYIKRELLYFAKNEMQKYKVTEQDFFSLKTNDAIRNILVSQVEKIERAYDAVMKAFKSINISSDWSRFLIIRMNIMMKTLRVIQVSQFNVLENYIDLTPIRRWWVSMKSRV